MFFCSGNPHVLIDIGHRLVNIVNKIKETERDFDFASRCFVICEGDTAQ